jgi:citrate lyase beta subunit
MTITRRSFHPQLTEKPSGWALGAPLYVPAMHPDLLKIANAEKISFIRTMIICTEDAIAEKDVELSIRNLRNFLPLINAIADKHRFIRPRNPEVLKRILDLPGIHKIDGFVLPKFNQVNRDQYLDALRGTPFLLMPTLETADVFDPCAMRELAVSLSEDAMKARMILIRIGGNDLLNLLGLRRPRGMTLYETPLSGVISQLVTTYKPLGFSLSAPVFEYLADKATLDREIRLDMAHGLVGKTAIHPNQIPMIERHYAVTRQDHEMALSILNRDMPAVFRMHDAMCEVSTHSNWARQILQRYHCYGQDQSATDVSYLSPTSSYA